MLQTKATKKSSLTESGYMIKHLKPTPFLTKSLVVSKRIGYKYCSDTDVEEVITLHELLLNLLSTFGGLTRTQLVKYTNIPRTSIFDALNRLFKEGKIALDYLNDGKRGRPKTIFKIVGS